MSISSDTLVEKTTQDTQIQVVCQTSQGQNLPGIGQTLEEYWSFAGQIPSSLSLPAEHARSLFPPANAGASQASSYSQRKAARGNWGGFCAHPVHIHDNSSSEQGNSLFHTVHSQEIHVQPYTSTAAKVRHCPSCNNHFKNLDILHTARIRAGKNLICTKSICMQATVSTWKQQAEEPPWLASRNPSGSLTLSEFSRHGKPSICVSPVPTQNATGIQWEAERKGEKKKQPTCFKDSSRVHQTTPITRAKVCFQESRIAQAKPCLSQTLLTPNSRKQQLQLQHCLNFRL